jgi:hypothetical protein
MNSTRIVHQYIIDNQDLYDEATRRVVAAYDYWAAFNSPDDYTAPDDRRGVLFWPSQRAAGEALADYIEDFVTKAIDRMHGSRHRHGVLAAQLLADALAHVDWRDISDALYERQT